MNCLYTFERRIPVTYYFGHANIWSLNKKKCNWSLKNFKIGHCFSNLVTFFCLNYFGHQKFLKIGHSFLNLVTLFGFGTRPLVTKNFWSPISVQIRLVTFFEKFHWSPFSPCIVFFQKKNFFSIFDPSVGYLKLH